MQKRQHLIIICSMSILFSCQQATSPSHMASITTSSSTRHLTKSRDRDEIQDIYIKWKKSLETMNHLTKTKHIELVQTLQLATVRVHADTGFGSGVIVNEGKYVLTVGHVTKKSKDVTIYLTHGTRIRGTVVKEIIARPFVTALDLGIIEIQNPEKTKIPSVIIGSAQPIKRKDPLLVLGYPKTHGVSQNDSIIYGIGPMKAIPRIGHFDGFISDTQFSVTNISLWHGDSGSPIFNSNGELVGLSCGIGRESTKSFFTSSDIALKYIQERENSINYKEHGK